MHMQDILKYGHQEIIRATEKLPSERWELPNACGVWSVKNIVAHLASYELMLRDVLGSLLDNNAETPMLKQMFELGDGWNDSAVESRKALNPDESFREYLQAYEGNQSLISQIPPALASQSGVLSWYGEAYDLDDFLVYSFYGHKREHAAQINAFCDILKREGEL